MLNDLEKWKSDCFLSKFRNSLVKILIIFCFSESEERLPGSLLVSLIVHLSKSALIRTTELQRSSVRWHSDSVQFQHRDVFAFMTAFRISNPQRKRCFSRLSVLILPPRVLCWLILHTKYIAAVVPSHFVQSTQRCPWVVIIILNWFSQKMSEFILRKWVENDNANVLFEIRRTMNAVLTTLLIF